MAGVETNVSTSRPAAVFWQTPFGQYGVAVASVMLATMIRFPLEPLLGGRAPYGLYFPVLVALAWCLGVAPTLFAAVLSLFAAWYFFVPPAFSFTGTDQYEASLIIYVATAGALVGLARSAAATRRALERALDESGLLAALVSSSEDAIVGVDLGGRILSWNAAAERMYGFRADEVIGRDIIALLIPLERRIEEAEILARLGRGETFDHFETVRIGKDGRRIDVSLSASPIRNAEGAIVGASKSARENHRAQARRTRAQRAARVVQGHAREHRRCGDHHRPRAQRHLPELGRRGADGLA